MRPAGRRLPTSGLEDNDNCFFSFEDQRLADGKITEAVGQNDQCSRVDLFSLEIMLKHRLTCL